MESNDVSRTASAQRQPQTGRWLRVAYALWIAFAVVVCGRIVIDAAKHPERHLHHTVYPVLAEGSRLWWSEQPLHGYIEELKDIYRYSPTFAILFTPLACLPDWLGACLWNLLSIGLFVAAMRVAARELLPGRWTTDREGMFLGLTLLGAMAGMWSGQSNALLISLVIFAMVAVKHERWWRASFLLAVPVFIKLWPLAVVLLLAACWPKQLSWRFAIVAVAFALFPFVTKPPSVVVWQYREWYESLVGPQQHRWPGFRDAWTIWEHIDNACQPVQVPPGANVQEAILARTNEAFLKSSFAARGYHLMQMATALAVLGWCLWQKRRLLAHADRGPNARRIGELLTAILSIWVCWQLLFGPGTELITYGIIAPSAAWAVMTSFEERNDRRNGLGGRFRVLFPQIWTVAAWLILGLFGMGDIETPLARANPATMLLLPLGVALFLTWFVIHYTGSRDCEPVLGETG